MGILKRKELGLFKWKVYRRKDDDEIKEELEVIARDCIDDVIDEIEEIFLKRNGCRVIKGIDRNKQVIIKSIDVLKDRGDHVGEVIAEFATTDSGSDEDISLGISIPIGFRFYIDTVDKTGNVMDYNLYKDAYGNIDYDGTFFKCVKNKEKFS